MTTTPAATMNNAPGEPGTSVTGACSGSARSGWDAFARRALGDYASGSPAVIVLFALLVALPAYGQQPETVNPAIAELESALVDLIARCEPSVVAISRSAPSQVDRPQVLLEFGEDPFGRLRAANQNRQVPYAHGAGVIIDPTGLILTQYLVVRPGDVHTVTTVDGKSYEAEIRGADPHSGLAVLAVKANNLPAIAQGDAEKLRKGQLVVSLSNPHAIQSDGQPTASWGIVSNLARKAAPRDNFNNVNDPTGEFRSSIHHFGTLIQTDARLGWGASGGALVNMQGEMVGLTTSADTIAGHEAAAGYAIPLNEPIRRIIDDLKQGREVEYGLLGISFNPEGAAPTATGDAGVIVRDVYPGSPAARAGVMANDVITHVADQPVPDPDRLQLTVRYLRPSSPALVRFVRDGQPQETEIVTGKIHVGGEKVVTSAAAKWRGVQVDHATALPPFQFQQSAQSGQIDPEGCVVVSEVDEGSPTWKAGVRAGMFISHVGEQRVSTPEEFRRAATSANGMVPVRLTHAEGQPEANTLREIPPEP